MVSFDEMYKRLLKASVGGSLEQEVADIQSLRFDPEQLDCLLNPKKHPVIIRTGECDCSEDERRECTEGCRFGAKSIGEGGVSADSGRCAGCGICIERCLKQNLQVSRDAIPAMQAVRRAKGLAYALVAPAFLGQFSPDVTPGKLRNSFKQIGFDGMIEVSLFADILTLKEALEFNRNIRKERDFQLASSCCPLWIALIRRVYNQLLPHVPCAVSPMIASGRAVKMLHPDAVTVFVGPCVAKKAEAREPDLAGAVDFVLTFQEVRDIFACAKVNPTEMEDTSKDHSSRCGRIYARAGGVSEAVEAALGAINPSPDMAIKTQRADGVAACKAMLNQLLEGKTDANFFEGMGCAGGCVGGPKSIIGAAEGAKNVDAYGSAALYATPSDNPYVIELLRRLGLPSEQNLLEDNDIFSRPLLGKE